MATVAAERQQQSVRSAIPARLDRLRWSPFHTRLVLGLGTAWILDGLEITIASSGPISGSTAATGSARSSARSPRSCCSTRCRRHRLAGGIPGRPGTRDRDPAHPPKSARKPPLALTHGRAAEAEASMKQIEDAAVKDGQHLAPVPGSAALTIIPEKEYGYLRLLRLILAHLPPPGGPRRDADDHPVVLVQRDLLHLRPGPDQVLPRHRQRGARVRAGVRGRQPGSARCCSATCSTPGAAGR